MTIKKPFDFDFIRVEHETKWNAQSLFSRAKLCNSKGFSAPV